MTEHCRHCGREICWSPAAKGPWNTSWLHLGGYNHCDPSPDGGPDRGEPTDQMTLFPRF